MISDFGGTTVYIDDLRSGYAGDLLAEADVIIAVDVSTHEKEVVYGRHAWERASGTGREEDLVVLWVELDVGSGDLEWLVDAIEAIESGETDEDEDDLENNGHDY